MVQSQILDRQICIETLHESAEKFLHVVTDISENYGIQFNQDCAEQLASHFRKVEDLIKRGSDAAIKSYINLLKRKTVYLNHMKNSILNDINGLSFQRISQFENFEADEQAIENGCVICIHDISLKTPMIKLDCKHAYCSECIRKWFEENKSCPQCRRIFTNV